MKITTSTYQVRFCRRGQRDELVRVTVKDEREARREARADFSHKGWTITGVCRLLADRSGFYYAVV